MRGTQYSQGAGRLDPGIIPAYAGNTDHDFFERRTSKDHPRVCGEHTSCQSIETLAQGSSPRMRGTLYQLVLVSAAVGIIPAYAGNTGHRWRVGRLAWDHPRVCGEHRI